MSWNAVYLRLEIEAEFAQLSRRMRWGLELAAFATARDELKRLDDRAYYQANRSLVLASAKRYAAAHRREISAYHRKRYKTKRRELRAKAERGKVIRAFAFALAGAGNPRAVERARVRAIRAYARALSGVESKRGKWLRPGTKQTA